MSPEDDKLQKSKLIDSCPNFFFQKEKKQICKETKQAFYVWMHHSAV
jgi:hypothetical protein